MKTNILLESSTNELEILEFTLAGKSFGINVAKVKELMQCCQVRALPNTHPCVEGVFQPRDELNTAVNLSKYLNLPDSGNLQKDIYIITSFNNMKVAFHVHGVESIHRISWSEIEKPDSIIYGGEDGIVTGIIKIEGKIIAILDFEKIAFDINPETSIKLSEIDGLGVREHSEKPILIAEDSILLRRLLLEAMHKAGYGNLLFVTNGAEAWGALEKIKDLKNPLDSVSLVITDIEMPQMDGLHLTKRIKEDQELKKLPVVIFSSIIDDKMRLKCEQAGSDAQLSKPEIGKLVSVIDELIKS